MDPLLSSSGQDNVYIISNCQPQTRILNNSIYLELQPIHIVDTDHGNHKYWLDFEL